jgi:uracil-DNA glycosylase
MSTALTSPFPDDRFSLAALHEPVDPSWAPVVAAFWNSVEGMRLQALLGERIAAGACVYPPNPLRALALTPLAEVRAIIIGQDPYHGPGQAEGLAFSVPRGVRVPPSLRNIFKEIHREYGGAGIVLDVPPSGQRHRTSGSLVPWAKQGVLLLNAVWTVESGQPAAHKGLGWEALTRAVLQAVATTAPPSVFLLWGAHAQALQGGLDLRRHRVLAANHPSPLSALRGPTPFLGCNHFRLCNDWLTSVGRPIINWFAD